MPPPDPRSSADDLDWTDQGPRSRRFGDVYYSLQDGLAESRAVFLEGCGLPDAWAGRTQFTVGELGFGSGLNLVALLDLWRRTRPPGGRLAMFSIEAYPLDRSDAARALAAWPELEPVAALLLGRWPPPTPGFHRIDLTELDATLDLAIGPVDWALSQWTGRADAWFLDGFSPALNPQMWSPEVLSAVTDRSPPGARLATFTVAGAVRRGLTEAGWQVDKRPGHGRKRERLEAVLPAPKPTPPPAPRRVAIVGAGIAGASVARALIALGVTPMVIETSAPGAGASGFPAALVTPRFDLGDAAIAALGAQSLMRAADLYDATPGAVVAKGVVRLEHGPRDAARFDRLAQQPIWPTGAMTRMDAAQAAQRLGQPTEAGGLWMDLARSVDPAAILKSWLPEAVVTAHAARIAPGDSGMDLIDADGRLITQADAVVLCGGWEGAGLSPDLALSPVRGQASWAEGPTARPVAWGGYVAPTPQGLMWGATHDRGDVGTGVRAEDEARVLETLAAVFPDLARSLAEQPRTSRAAVRAATPDRLPVCGPAPGRPGLFVLGGLGSRGFAFAPLLGEHIAALIAGTPSPLPADLGARIDPARKSVKVGDD